jgi:RNA polymerase sigma factor (sigma-70 family)
MFDIDRAPEQQIDDLWREHSAALVQFATVLVGPSDANDIVVEAFLRSSAVIVGGTIEHPRAYLYRAVTNQAHDWRRSRERRWQRDLAAIGPNQVGPLDTHIDVRRAVAALSLGQRAVVYLAYWEDQTEREIAASLNLSLGTVRRHLFRAKAHLRKALP